MAKPVICIMGPTASGKTALAIELVAQLPVEIISVDSALIYQHLSIGTAKPSSQELSQAPHHLLSFLDPRQSYSAAEFCQDATRLIEDIFSRKKIPLLVGGTMLYFKALQQGLANLPAADVKLRAQLSLAIQQHGIAHLYQQLTQYDPAAAAQIDPHDTQRISRALEVYYLTGQPLTAHWQAAKAQHRDYQFINIALFPMQRAQLHQRIAARFQEMLQQGLIDEVVKLRVRGDLDLSLPAMRTVGYRQVWQYLDGEFDYDTLVEKGIAATRQLAKRQMTWLRHWPEAQFFDPFPNPAATKLSEAVLAYLRTVCDMI